VLCQEQYTEHKEKHQTKVSYDYSQIRLKMPYGIIIHLAFQACEDTSEGKGKPKYMIKELILRAVSQRNGEKVFYLICV
jgi:hypothetical protein